MSDEFNEPAPELTTNSNIEKVYSSDDEKQVNEGLGDKKVVEENLPETETENPNNQVFNMNLSDEEIEKIGVEADEIKAKGNAHFQKKEYLEALSVYLYAIKSILKDYTDDVPPYTYNNAEIPERLKKTLSVVFMNRGLTFKNLKEVDKAIDMFSKSLVFNSNNGKSLYQRLELLYAKEEYMEAQEDYTKLKTVNPSLLYEFKVSEYTLNYKAEQKKKEMTQQMMGQLKDVGNSFLGLFGLSTDNFQVNQQAGGGYNIQFKNN